MWIFPAVSIVLACIAMVLSIRQFKKHNQQQTAMTFFILSGLLGLALLIFMGFYIQDANIVTLVPAVVYILAMIVGIGTEIFSLVKTYVPGQLMSVAVHIFVGFAALLSIGLVFLILAFVELVIAFMMLRREKVTTSVT